MHFSLEILVHCKISLPRIFENSIFLSGGTDLKSCIMSILKAVLCDLGM